MTRTPKELHPLFTSAQDKCPMQAARKADPQRMWLAMGHENLGSTSTPAVIAPQFKPERSAHAMQAHRHPPRQDGQVRASGTSNSGTRSVGVIGAQFATLDLPSGRQAVRYGQLCFLPSSFATRTEIHRSSS